MLYGYLYMTINFNCTGYMHYSLLSLDVPVDDNMWLRNHVDRWCSTLYSVHTYSTYHGWCSHYRPVSWSVKFSCIMCATIIYSSIYFKLRNFYEKMIIDKTKSKSCSGIPMCFLWLSSKLIFIIYTCTCTGSMDIGSLFKVGLTYMWIVLYTVWAWLKHAKNGLIWKLPCVFENRKWVNLSILSCS